MKCFEFALDLTTPICVHLILSLWMRQRHIKYPINPSKSVRRRHVPVGKLPKPTVVNKRRNIAQQANAVERLNPEQQEINRLTNAAIMDAEP